MLNKKQYIHRSTVLSALFPGMGQLFQGHRLKGLIIYFTFPLLFSWIYGVYSARKFNEDTAKPIDFVGIKFCLFFELVFLTTLFFIAVSSLLKHYGAAVFGPSILIWVFILAIICQILDIFYIEKKLSTTPYVITLSALIVFLGFLNIFKDLLQLFSAVTVNSLSLFKSMNEFVLIQFTTSFATMLVIMTVMIATITLLHGRLIMIKKFINININNKE